MGRNQPKNKMGLLSTGLDSAQPKPHDWLLFTAQYTLINFPVTVHMHSTPNCMHVTVPVNYISLEQCKHKAKKCRKLQFNQSWKSETSLLITLKKQFRRHQNTLSPETETYNRSYNRSHAFLQETEGQKT
jgi:hypothetical protein